MLMAANFHAKVAQILGGYSYYSDNHKRVLNENQCCYSQAPCGKIGLLFISTSGHTGYDLIKVLSKGYVGKKKLKVHFNWQILEALLIEVIEVV